MRFDTHKLRALVPAPLRPMAKELHSKSLQLRAKVFPQSREHVFTKIYQSDGFHVWTAGPSVSGPGSDLEQTSILSGELPGLLADLGVRSILDAPCGDFYWMQQCPIDVDRYLGMDIVPALIESNIQRFRSEVRHFAVGDLVTDDLPRVDAIFCRDCIVHLTLHDGIQMIENFKRSGSTYLLTTTYTDRTANKEVDGMGRWRPLNLQIAPFGLPPPLRVVNEGCTEFDSIYLDKCIAVWKLDDLN